MSDPIITFEQISKERYGNSIIHRFHLLVDGVKVLQPEPTPSDPNNPEDPVNEPEEFAIQVQDGCCHKQALKDFLDSYRATLTADHDSVPDMELPNEV